MTRRLAVWTVFGLVLAAGRGSAQQVVTVAITGPGAAVTAGDTVALRAVARDSAGREVPGVSFRWFSNAPLAAAVTDSGQLIALDVGHVAVFALGGGKMGRLELDVAPGPVASLAVQHPKNGNGEWGKGKGKEERREGGTRWH